MRRKEKKETKRKPTKEKKWNRHVNKKREQNFSFCFSFLLFFPFFLFFSFLFNFFLGIDYYLYQQSFSDLIYSKPWSRAAPYFIGVILALFWIGSKEQRGNMSPSTRLVGMFLKKERKERKK